MTKYLGVKDVLRSIIKFDGHKRKRCVAVSVQPKDFSNKTSHMNCSGSDNNGVKCHSAVFDVDVVESIVKDVTIPSINVLCPGEVT